MNPEQERSSYPEEFEEIPLLPSNQKYERVYSRSWKAWRQSYPIQIFPSLLIGTAIWFGTTPSENLTPTAIHLLAVFTSCIFALITTSIDICVLVLTSLTLLSLTKSFVCTDHTTGNLTECRLCGELDPVTGQLVDCEGIGDAFGQSLKGFSSTVVWLIFAAFHFGKAIQITQLGRRISLKLIQRFGRRIMGLAYAIVLSELFLAPFIPSNTARGGGIVLPIVDSIATTLGSTPTRNPKLGGFLMLVGTHANLISASMYLTGMASNPIVVAKASQLFPNIQFNFVTWLVGSSVPALVCAFSIPFILYWACGLSESKGEQKNSEDNIIHHAEFELERMGSMSIREWQLCLTLLGCLFLWVTSSYTHLDATLVALIGIVSLLHMGTMTWKDISTNTNAWDTLFWLGGFVTIAQQLSQAGASAYLGHVISNTISRVGWAPVPCLAVAFFLTTFMFSSLSAHTVAFIATFLEAGHSLGANPLVLTALLAYFSALGGCMTNFSTGSMAMYYAPGYVRRSKWFSIGLMLAVFYLFIYLTLGMLWWKFLGWQ
ncbi:hypothetical protein EC973_005396 [Apophysomyces ossiformis]|uniref:Uncharacterized protein n=1 Tax=Apophysomyces ossiformis TaxID=679940 RepID=A0A8H7BJN9_9FUNG|nr:hypothetical protein EC973_005396 [Apophysomyces ossiformis]